MDERGVRWLATEGNTATSQIVALRHGGGSRVPSPTLSFLLPLGGAGEGRLRSDHWFFQIIITGFLSFCTKTTDNDFQSNA